MFTVVPSYAEEATQWRRHLSAPSPAAVAERAGLLARAAQLTQTVPRFATRLALDVVVSGCGFMALYYLGVHTVLSRLEERGDLKLHRFAGVSSGAKTPMHVLLAGEADALDHHLAYGELCSARGGSLLHAAMRNDRCGRVTFEHLLACHGESGLAGLTSRMHVCVAQHTLRGPRRAVLSDFRDAQRAREFWHATGTLLTRVQGLGWCGDGGQAGNTPLFEDSERGQLLCQPQRSGLPRSMVFHYTPQQAKQAVQQGQDDAVALLTRLAQPEPQQGGEGPAALVVVPAQPKGN